MNRNHAQDNMDRCGIGTHFGFTKQPGRSLAGSRRAAART